MLQSFLLWLFREFWSDYINLYLEIQVINYYFPSGKAITVKEVVF